MFVNPDGQPALAPSGLIQACFLGKSCDFTIWLIDTMNLLSAMGSYMLSTTHALSHQLSPASRYLRPSSYLRHALLLGFSSSPSYIFTHSVVFDMYIFFSPFLFMQILYFRHPALPFCWSLSLAASLFLSLFLSVWTDSRAAHYSSLPSFMESLSLFIQLWISVLLLHPTLCISLYGLYS